MKQIIIYHYFHQRTVMEFSALSPGLIGWFDNSGGSTTMPMLFDRVNRYSDALFDCWYSIMIVHETKRLFLETWVLEDFEAFASIARDPQVMRFIAEGNPWPDSRIGWFMGNQSALQETLGFCNWKLTNRASRELVGFCGIAPLYQIDEIEIGWWLKPSYWKQGLALEAAECVADAAFKEHACHRIVARAYRANTNSVILMGRLGMVFDRVLETTPMGEIVLYRIDKSDFL